MPQVGENVLCLAGFLLTMAMALSLVEVYYGASHGVLRSAAGFPWMHIVIHMLEQVGIYLSGFGSAYPPRHALRVPTTVFPMPDVE